MNKNNNLFIFKYFLFIITLDLLFSQMVDDPVGDIPNSDPDYMDIERVRLSQYTDNWDISNVSIEFYPNDAIPEGNQVGINTTTIFEVYMDVDEDTTTGVSLEDIGYDYKLHANLYKWNGKSWINGKVFWDFDTNGNPQSHNAFYISADGLISWRFRWVFSLVSLKWPHIDWVARTFYDDHLSDQIPDEGHGSLDIDTSTIADIDTVRGEFVEFIYPLSFQEIMEEYEVLEASELAAQIESQLCGTNFSDIQTLQFNPWLQGVAYCGNPVMMGSWSWRNTPPWFVVFHELGHNFTLASVRFKQLYPGLGYIPMGNDDWNFGMNFVEAWATMVGLYAMHELYTNNEQYQVSSESAASLEQAFINQKSNYLGKLEDYEENPCFNILYPDLVDGIFLSLADSFSYDIFPKFFNIIQPPDQTWDALEEIDPNDDYYWSKVISMTVTCCAFSVATGKDLRDLFRDKWDFPISDSYYEQIKPEIENMITDIDEELFVNEMKFQLYPNYPNPFNASTIISFYINRYLKVKIKIYNLQGQLISVLYNGYVAAGFHQTKWNAEKFPTGVYICSLETEYGRKTSKLMILK